MIDGDFLVHQQEDGRVALHDLQTWRDNGAPLRFFGTLADAHDAAHGERAGGTVWFSHWHTPDEISRF